MGVGITFTNSSGQTGTKDLELDISGLDSLIVAEAVEFRNVES